MDEIERKMSEIKWSYAEGDPDALASLAARIEGVGRREDLINYSDLVRGVTFHLPNVNKGEPFQIDIHEWPDLHRAILGEFLGYISMLSYRKAKFMASALAINKTEFKPSYHFFNWMKDLGMLSGRDV
ncbi:MAG TPA: hypothetical protein VMZ30_20050, partial [Pyrinomonadaceae bacterium]|nr:hypothetical protein [Pyrinomonadaceae bacterium]